MKLIKIINKLKYSFLLLICLILILYLIIYIYFVYPLYNLSTIQTKDEMDYLNTELILGITDQNRLAKLTNFEKNDVSFFYTYFFFRSEKYTIWCIFNKNNKFSNSGNIVLYFYNHENGNVGNDKLYINFNDVVTYVKDKIIYIKYLDNYCHEINLEKNTMNLYIYTNKNTLDVDLYIDEYKTTMPPLLFRYFNINRIVNTGFIETNSPNEWASDNPFIGKIINGKFNNYNIESNGNFWFDNLIGCNNFFVSEYYWFAVLDDNWLLYIVFYGKYEEINSPNLPISLYIKNRKQNKIIHCSPGPIPSIFKTIDNKIHPVKINYKSNSAKKIGDKSFDDYSIEFMSNDIKFKIDSIKNESTRVLLYDYYNDPKMDTREGLNEWDSKYKDVLNNLGYAEYINKVNVDIQYNNSHEKYETMQILNGVFPKNKRLPSTIKYS